MLIYIWIVTLIYMDNMDCYINSMWIVVLIYKNIEIVIKKRLRKTFFFHIVKFTLGRSSFLNQGLFFFKKLEV